MKIEIDPNTRGLIRKIIVEIKPLLFLDSIHDIKDIYTEDIYARLHQIQKMENLIKNEKTILNNLLKTKS